MKSIGWKFVLCAGAFALAFSLVVIVHTWSVSRESMTEATEDSLALGLHFDLAIRDYVGKEIRPVVQEHVGEDEFIPATMSSTYVARSIFEKVRREHPDYIIKFSSDNPRNPVNVAGPEELAVLEHFRQTPEAKHWTGQMILEGRECMVRAMPRRMEQSCLQCHGDPHDAPASLLAAYGDERGFHRELGDVIAMDLVGVPTDRIDAALSSQATTQIAFLVLCLLGLVGVLVVAFRHLVTRRLAALHRHFCRVAEDPSCLNVASLAISGCDEIAGLARSFNALVSKVRLYQTSLESMVAQRTRKLAAEVAERKRTEQELRLNEARLEAVLKLNQMTEASLLEITAFALEEGVRLTQSKIGYLAFVNDDETELTMHSWSAEAMRECAMIEKPLKYQVSQTGLWGEAIRQRRPVVTNDYSAPSPMKKGCPSGHVPIARHANVPILSGERIVAVAGVGNKEEPYDDADVRQLTLLMQGMWGLLERRRAVERLRESEEKYRLLTENQKDVVASIALDGRLLYCSPSAREFGGYDVAEEIGQPLAKYLADESEQPRLWAAIQRMIADRQSATVEFLYRKKDGSVIPVEVTGKPTIQHGEVTAIQCVIRDISERKQAERALLDARQRQRLHFEQTPLGVIEWSPNFAITEWNPAAEAIFGYSREEALGKDGTMMVPANIRGSIDSLWHSMISGRVGVRGTNENLRKDGATILCDWYNTPLIDETGQVVGVASLVQDITARRRAEEQLRAAMEDAKAADRAKSLFLANMSHEIRTPMTAILGYVDLLLGPEGPEELAEDHRQALETVRRNGEHLLHLINDILDLSKVEAGKLQVDRRTCRTAEILEEVVRLTQIRAQAKRLPLRVDYLGGVPESISTDPVRLRQILVNLATNAIKFTDSGEVRILVRLAKSAEGKPMLELAVRDTGIGLTETEIGRLFQPFNQIDHGINRMHGGTGLGLAISIRLARALGGNIVVQSTPGKGSTFTLSIDPGDIADARMLDRFEQPTSDHSTDQPPSFDESRLDGRVLLAEDGPDNQRLISHVLRKAGAEVTIVDNGQRAVDEALSAAAAETPFDIVLMDMQMPVMDGYAATQLLRRNGYRGLIVALTAHAMADDRQRCLDAGCDWYMSKPVTRQALLATLGWLKRQRASAVQ